VGLHPTTTTLTTTERRVAELVGSGHSNRETAAELFMSVKTMEANLTRIYRKLSVRSRTELASRLNTLDAPNRQDQVRKHLATIGPLPKPIGVGSQGRRAVSGLSDR
jgi:DNA-binding CsgD family transcriptional regulator